MGSLKLGFPGLRRSSTGSVFFFDDGLDRPFGRFVLSVLAVFPLDDVEVLLPDCGLTELTGGWLWNRQKTWYNEARILAAITLHSGPCSPS